MHAHLDKGEVIPRVQPDGTLNRAAILNATDQTNWSDEDLRRRMGFSLRCAYVQGVSAIRSHLDYRGNATEKSWNVFQALRNEWNARIKLQAAGLALLELYSTPAGVNFADLIARNGGILGGVTDVLADPHPAKGDIDRLLDNFLEIAGNRGLDVDLHTDQTANPELFHLPNIAKAVIRTGFIGKVVVDHCVNLALQPDDIARETIQLCAEAGLAFVTLPSPMLYLQDRTPGRTPRWRGVTLVHEIRAAGIPIALAGDNCRDSWYPYGDHDMVDTFRQGVRIFQLDHPVDQTPAMVGPVPASIIGLPNIGSITQGAEARLILFRARTLNEILSRPQSDRIVLDRGRRIVDPLPDYTELD
jgi:cytosine deaminase